MSYEYDSREEAASDFIQACFWLGKYPKDTGERRIKSAGKDFCADFRVKDCTFLPEDLIVLNSNALVLLKCRGECENVIFRDSEESIRRAYCRILNLREVNAVRGSVEYYTVKLRD